MAYETDRPEQRDPLRPLLGFILLLVVGALAWIISPGVTNWLTTTHFELGAFGWQVLPLTFPDVWPDIAVRGIVALFMFLVVFITLLVIFMILLKPPRGGHDVTIAQARARQKEILDKRGKS
jgi:TRAP-type C4-dicarboxylate transport system permease small subunit